MTAIPADRQSANLRLGLALSVIAAIVYGALPSLVRLAYAGGADETAVILVRSLFIIVFSATIAGALGKPLLPPRGMRLVALALGAVWLAGAYSYVAAIRRIPIGLAVTIFYLFPLIVALIARVWDGERLSTNRIAGLTMGFAGVTLAVGASFGGIETGGMALAGGVALAGVAAVCVACTATLSARLMRVSSPYSAMLVMAAGSGAVLGIVAAGSGLNLPTTALSWFGLIAGAVGICVSMACFYTSITLIGAVRASIVCNLEPIAATVLAFLVLGEALGPWQLAGVVLVVAAILVMQARGLGRR